MDISSKGNEHDMNQDASSTGLEPKKLGAKTWEKITPQILLDLNQRRTENTLKMNTGKITDTEHTQEKKKKTEFYICKLYWLAATFWKKVRLQFPF